MNKTLALFLVLFITIQNTTPLFAQNNPSLSLTERLDENYPRPQLNIVEIKPLSARTNYESFLGAIVDDEAFGHAIHAVKLTE